MVLNKNKAETEAEKCSQLLTKRTMLSPSLALLVFIFSAKSGDGAQIIGGTEVTPHSLPSMALVEGRGVNGEQIFCGGTLIHPKWVLSAAHCAGQEISVTLGVHSRENEGQGMRFRQIRRVSRQVIQPGYLPQQINDLMLLELESPVEETANVKSYRIYTTPNYPGAGKTCLVAGWGLTGYGASNPSDVLMAANVNVIDLETCNSADCYDHSNSINNDVVCAGSHGRNQIGVWKGDSGGPLMCDNVLVGVTSFGKESCPAVFMYLSQDRVQWIQQTI
ncbi:mast cell protease 4-like [Synchiropus picturatus]